MTNLSYIFIIQLPLSATSHYCQYFENGTRLISIATVSLEFPRYKACNGTQRYRYGLLHNRRPFFFFSFIQLFLVYPSRNRQFHYPEYFFVSLAHKVKPFGNRRNRCRRIISRTISCLDRVSGATGGEIHREIK